MALLVRFLGAILTNQASFTQTWQIDADNDACISDFHLKRTYSFFFVLFLAQDASRTCSDAKRCRINSITNTLEDSNIEKLKKHKITLTFSRWIAAKFAQTCATGSRLDLVLYGGSS
ncbi:uncharacterized protein MEPE_06531 [Melanopsichium pennsylvanicum]|uniref:Uncharacterized protein n=1 Tax=Melanopsichium pennsylvanicum TaxID=63383 RepID=A0AAJ4XSN3_9BASI|nr:uncharacterized protein MEPE_06531 [Melanopsichium pennsylvanicum]